MINKDKCERNGFPHNRRARYPHGFFCEDCCTFFPFDSDTYRRYEYTDTLYMVVWNIGIEHNVNVVKLCKRLNKASKLSQDKLNRLINETLMFIALSGETDKSATIVLK